MNTTVAKYSPSGYYIASGGTHYHSHYDYYYYYYYFIDSIILLLLDVQGNVRIWDATQEEQILKNEVKVIAGRINDIDWDFESKRLIAVGEGRER